MEDMLETREEEPVAFEDRGAAPTYSAPRRWLELTRLEPFLDKLRAELLNDVDVSLGH